jgi:hypothetical protein
MSLSWISVEITIGKVVMCNKEVFKKNVDVCMMIHPSAVDTVYNHMLAVDHVSVEFFGKPSHAAGKSGLLLSKCKMGSKLKHQMKFTSCTMGGNQCT